jgi:hypothetical protein
MCQTQAVMSNAGLSGLLSEGLVTSQFLCTCSWRCNGAGGCWNTEFTKKQPQLPPGLYQKRWYIRSYASNFLTPENQHIRFPAVCLPRFPLLNRIRCRLAKFLESPFPVFSVFLCVFQGSSPECQYVVLSTYLHTSFNPFATAPSEFFISKP